MIRRQELRLVLGACSDGLRAAIIRPLQKPSGVKDFVRKQRALGICLIDGAKTLQLVRLFWQQKKVTWVPHVLTKTATLSCQTAAQPFDGLIECLSIRVRAVRCYKPPSVGPDIPAANYESLTNFDPA